MTKEECQAKLYELNNQVDALLIKRTKFLNSHAELFMEFPIGSELVNASTGREVVVTGYSRFIHSIPQYDSQFLVSMEVSGLANRIGKDVLDAFSFNHPYIKQSDYESQGQVYINKLKMMTLNRDTHRR